MTRRRHTRRMVAAALAVFATAFVGGTLRAAMFSDMTTASAQPMFIHESGVARFVTTDTGIYRAVNINSTLSPFQRFLLKLGIGPRNQPLVLTEETVQTARELGVATVTKHQDGNRTLTIQTPSEWVFDLRNE